VSRGMYWEAVRLVGFPENIGSHVRPLLSARNLATDVRAALTLSLHLQIYMNPDGTALSTYENLDKYEHFVRVYTRGGILAEEMVRATCIRVLNTSCNEMGSLTSLSFVRTGFGQDADHPCAHHPPTPKC
jgi:hypothetical protein